MSTAQEALNDVTRGTDSLRNYRGRPASSFALVQEVPR